MDSTGAGAPRGEEERREADAQQPKTDSPTPQEERSDSGRAAAAEAGPSGDEEDEKRPSTSADEEKSAEAAAAAGESIDNKDSNDGVAVKTEATVAPPRKTSVIFADRKITTNENVDEIGLYSMCRSWFRNETEVLEASETAEDSPGLKLPPPTPKAKVEEKEHKEPVQHTAEEETALASKEGEDAMDVDVAPCDKEKRLVLIPAAADSSKKAEAEELSKDVLFKGHMKRWKAIKKDRSRQHRLNSERFEDRLKLLLDNK